MAKDARGRKDQVCCPFCDAEITESSPPFCKACKVKVMFCPQCKKPVARNEDKCTSCGESFKNEE